MSFRGEATMPGWLATLVRQLPEGGAQAPPELLSPITALEEVKTVTRAILDGRRGPSKLDCLSLETDLQASFEGLGPASAALHSNEIKTYRLKAAQLDVLLKDTAGARALEVEGESLLNQLSSPQSLLAALDDSISAFASDAFVAECETRLRYLRSVVERTSREWSERARRLHDALAGSYSALLEAGALDPPHAGEPRHIDEAGLSLDERVWLSKTAVTAEPPRGSVVVWVAFANAFLPAIYLEKGPVELYDSRIWPAVVDGQWPANPGWMQPPELQDPEASLFLDGMPPKDFVMVRVSLDGPLADARERGRSLARAAVELTGWDTDWVLMDGDCCYASHWFGSMGFRDPRERALSEPDTALLDPTGRVLPDIEAGLLQRIADGDVSARELLADTRWRRAIATVPDAEHRIALLVALLERALVPSAVASERWYGACARSFGLLLPFDDVRRQVWDAGYYGVRALSRIPEGHSQFLAFDKALIEHKDELSFNVHLGEVIRAAPRLRAHLDSASMEARMLAEVEQRTRDGPAAAAWLTESRTGFDQLLARARRQRNAIAHGTRTVPGVLATVEPFLDRVVGRLIGAIHYCVATQRDLATELDAWRGDRLRTCDRLLAGASADLLFSRPV
jgi:hypothetical protein